MIKRLEDATKAGAAIVAVIYLFGFLVNALHLGKYGVSGIGLLRVRYVLAGVWVTLPFVALAMITAMIAYVVTFEYDSKEPRTRRWHMKKLGSVLTSLAGFAIILSLVLSYVWSQVPITAVHERGVRAAIGPLALLAMLIWFFGAVIYAAVTHRIDESPRLELVTAVGFSTFLIIAVLAYLVYFASRVYPHLPAVLGGGAPLPVQFVLKGPSTLQPKKPYELLLVTDSAVVVRDGDHAIEVSRDAIETIIYPAPPKE